MRYLNLLLVGLIAITFASCTTNKQSISDGSVVRLEYKGTLKDGTVFDTTDGKDPLTFLVGANQVIPAFEKQVVKLDQGQSKKFTIKADEAYGEPDPKKVVTLPRDGRFKDVKLEEGAMIFANNKAPNGQVQQTPMKIVGISEAEVTLDYNHPLAGKDLTFDVKVLEVKAPQVDSAQPGEQAAEEAPTQEEAAAS